MNRKGRAGSILWENRNIIDQMMQQMDDFAAQNGGYINRSGVGNFRTQKGVYEDDEEEENESPAEERKEKMMAKKGKKSKMMDKDELEEVKEASRRRNRRK